MKHFLFPVIIAALAVFSCGSSEPGQTPAAPAEPTNLRIELPSPTSATLIWEHDGKGVEGWWVFLRKEKEPEGILPLNQSSPLSAQERSYTFAGLTKGASYYFGVRAKGNGISGLTAYTELTAIPSDKPQPADSTGTQPEDPTGTNPADSTGTDRDLHSFPTITHIRLFYYPAMRPTLRIPAETPSTTPSPPTPTR